MTDLSAIKSAIARVIVRCHAANPGHRLTPVDGATAMEWLLEELDPNFVKEQSED